MNIELSQKLKNHFVSLPQNVQEAFLAMDFKKELSKIPEAEPLQESQKIAIENEIAGIFLGLADIHELTTVIKHQADITRERAENISKAIMLNIFAPNANILKQVFGVKKGASTASAPTKISDGVMQKATPKKDPYKEPIEQRNETGRLGSVEQQVKKEQVASLDVFKKRLTTPVHTPMKEEKLIKTSKTPGERAANANPSSAKQVASDPYKETIE